MKNVILLLLAMWSVQAMGSASRILDGQQITNGAATLTLPTTTDTILGRATTDTLTNKSISGATNTLSAIPAATALTGQVPVANGGTSLSTLTTGALVVGAGSSAPTFVSPGSNGQVLTVVGGAWASAASPTAPTITGSTGTPSNITAAGGIAFTGSNYANIWFIQGSPGAVTVTATPQVAVGTSVGQVLKLVGQDNTKTVTLADGNGLALNGSWVGALDSFLTLVWDGTNWIEESRR